MLACVIMTIAATITVVSALTADANTIGGPRVTRFELVDAASNSPIGPLRLDDTVDLLTAPSPLNVRAVTNPPQVGSVVFKFDGVVVRTENQEPYALGGDTQGDYAPFELPLGSHAIEATAYTGPDGTGTAGLTRFLRVHVGESNFVVDRTDDASDTAPGDGQCVASGGGCTLRAAVEEANALDGPQWIGLEGDTHELTLGQIEVTDGVTIRGSTQAHIEVNASDTRAFFVTMSPLAGELRLDNVTISGGSKDLDGGGAIRVAAGAHLRLLDVILEDNTAQGGAGLYNSGGAILQRTTVRNNISDVDLCGGVTSRGGGIRNFGDLTMHDSAIIANEAVIGGGIANHGPAVIVNTTVSGNIAKGGGGGIYNADSDQREAELDIGWSTIADNQANVNCLSGDVPDDQSVGGGIYNRADITIGSSILANNTDNRFPPSDRHYSPDCWTLPQRLTSVGGNVLGIANGNCQGRLARGVNVLECEPNGCIAAGPDAVLASDLWGTPDEPLDADLSALSNGVHPLGVQSPAVDFGGSIAGHAASVCPASDQVHRDRPRDGNGNGGIVCDSGAYER